MSKKKLPLVAICGRPNVGKSTLFNRVSGRAVAIVHSQEGITRDRFYRRAVHNGRLFRVVDTGGVVENPTDAITHKMQEQVRAALEEATVVLFVVDGQQELTRTDEEIRDELFRLGKPVVLAVNKMDNARLATHATDYYSLGLGDPHAISSGHGIGVHDMMDAVMEMLPGAPSIAEDGVGGEDAEDDDEDVSLEKAGPIRVAVIGRPNVGKSSFINALLNEERTIVTDIPGTTRDAIDIEFTWQGRDYLFIDTAGLRKKAGIKEDVEHYSVSRTLRSIRRADVCLVMVDATDGIGEQDKRIINYVVEQGAAMALVWTKWDLIENKEQRFKALAEEIDFKAPFLKHVPSFTISNLTRQRLFSTFDYINRIAESAIFRVGTGEFNRFLEDLKASAPPAGKKGRHLKIYYGTQTGVQPTTFVFFVNDASLVHFSFQRFIENQIRTKYGFHGVPLKIEFRAHKEAPES